MRDIVIFSNFRPLVSFLRIEGGGVMKNYVSPRMELVIVNITDVITASNEELMKIGDNEFSASSIFS